MIFCQEFWLDFYFCGHNCLLTILSSEKPNLQVFDDKCIQLLKDDSIRFAGIIDDKGELISGGFKDGLTPLEGDETRLKSFMEFVSKVSIRKEYDVSLGPINYLAARRDKAVLVSFPFPVSKILLLISAEPKVDIEKLASKVVDVFTGVS